MLPIHVISLPRCTDRRERVAERFGEAGVEFEFLDAHDGESGRASFESIDDARFTVMTGRAVQPGEIGCYASHLALWQRCVDTGQPLVVFEDDFELLPNFAEVLDAAAEAVERCGYLRLQEESSAWSVDAGQVGAGPFRVRRYTKAPQEMLAYVISPEAARRLIAGSRILYAPVDVFLIREFDHGQPLYALTPYSVRVCTIHQGTMIGGRTKVPKNLATRVARTAEKTRRLAWRSGLHAALKLRRPLLR